MFLLTSYSQFSINQMSCEKKLTYKKEPQILTTWTVERPCINKITVVKLVLAEV